MAARRYDNSLRAGLAEQTRDRIVDAARDLLAGSEPLSTAAVAARAGVSEPTVYRWFGSRDGLLEAVAQRFSRQLGEPPMGEAAEDLPAMMVALAHYFGRNSAWMRASMNNPAAGEVRLAGRRRREAGLRALIEPRTRHLEPRERELVIAILLTLVRMESWDLATRRFGLDDDEAGRAAGWAVEALLQSLERGKKSRQRTLLDAAVVSRGRSWETRDASRVVKRPPKSNPKPKPGRDQR